MPSGLHQLIFSYLFNLKKKPWCQAVCTNLLVDFSAKSAFLVVVHLVAGLPKLPESKSFEILRKHKKEMLIWQVSPIEGLADLLLLQDAPLSNIINIMYFNDTYINDNTNQTRS